MISEFGKYLINIRKNNKQNIVEMSQKLNLALSFLSRIEQSKDYIDDRIVDEIILNYNLDKNVASKLHKAKDISNKIYNDNKAKVEVVSDIDLSRKVESNDDLIIRLKGVLNDQN